MPAPVTLPALLQLFKIDRDIRTLEIGLDGVQKEEKAISVKLDALNKQIATQDTAAKKIQAQISNSELEVKTRQEHIEKMRTSLNATKTNKEYSAILLQISAEKAEVSKMETAMLEAMQKLETENGAISALKAQSGDQQKALEKVRSEQNQRVSDLKNQINTLKENRVAAAAAVKPDALSQYDRVSKKYPGDAMAAVSFDDSDLESASCESCYMGLNVEHVNALRGRDDIRKCNSCGRILYLPEMMISNATASNS
jgi:predicted  nucleic acid-binding Zn-ribbon protein